ncbi:TetR/AcrR family transcriptional regulator [Frankia sp. R43]|uniref:TetR/AcrR family transcriptional regulator n=1 Tax=Frankia sp. R43 TaxID=269536 RepID=UPI0013799545|nr:TetR/AcrR family transcriptional regulator [Frankia sp. R43]
MAEKAARKYDSPLRQGQAERTRGVILDALSELLRTHHWDDVTTKLLAGQAGVAQQTIYRHFPDREALIAALRARTQNPHPYSGPPASLEEWASRLEVGFRDADQHFLAEVTANTLFNADTRRFAHRPEARSTLFSAAVEGSFPELGEDDLRRAAALMRILGSTQTWLRMREEFGLDGSASGQLVKWAINVLVREIKAGNLPPRERPAESTQDAE